MFSKQFIFRCPWKRLGIVQKFLRPSVLLECPIRAILLDQPPDPLDSLSPEEARGIEHPSVEVEEQLSGLSTSVDQLVPVQEPALVVDQEEFPVLPGLAQVSNVLGDDAWLLLTFGAILHAGHPTDIDVTV